MKRLREWFDGLAERERRLVLVFVAAISLVLVMGVPYLASLSLDSKRQEIQDLRAAISLVQNSRAKVADRQKRRENIAARYSNRAPALAGFLENAAHQAGLAIPESQDLPELPHGKRFVERSTVVRLRKVGLLSLVRMFEKIENSPHPLVISKLHLRRRGGETDSYDVEINVSAYDSVSAAPVKETKPSESAKPTSSGDAQ